MRLDKWLWAARFFKTRSLATKACELGRVESNEHAAKPSREARVGDRLRIRNASGDYQVEVLLLSETRGPAAAAQNLYRETDESKAARLKLAEERKAMTEFDLPRDVRPSKKDRRVINRIRGRF